ncbi:MAG: multidrug efflux SMR transporter [Bacteroidota bacterium]
MKAYLFLILAIAGELFATASLKKADGFTEWLPSFFAVLGYALSAFFLSNALKEIPIGVAYAIWASLGIVFTAIFGWLVYKQQLDFAGATGISLILLGVLILNLLSKSAAH